MPVNPSLSFTEWINPIIITMPNSYSQTVPIPIEEPTSSAPNKTVTPPVNAPPIQQESIVSQPITQPPPIDIDIPQIDRIATDEKPVVWVDLSSILFWIWVIGMIVAVLIKIFQFIRFGLFLRRNSVKVTNPEIHNVIKAVQIETGVTKSIGVLKCKFIDSPMVIGLFKTKLVFPTVIYNKSEIYAILRHELSHIKLNHLFIKAVVILAEIIHWFNPFVYLMTRMINKELELACDSRVLKITSQDYSTEYSKAILSAIRRAQQRENAVLHFATALDGGEPTNTYKTEFDFTTEKGNDI